MKTTKYLCLSIWTATILMAPLVQAASPSTAFTYQGRLFVGDVPANGLYDLQFTNYDAAAGGTALGAFNTNALAVTNGLFTVTLDFGAVFDGTPRWLEISERTNGVETFATLAPRQLLAAAPYATYAASAGSAGAVAGLTILQNADGAPNVIGGSPWNWVDSGVVGATIGGGGATNYNGNAFTNSVSADFGTIGGGYRNTIQANADLATIGGGDNNTIQTSSGDAAIGGGYGNTIQNNSSSAAIGGGNDNNIEANSGYSTIGGGEGHSIRSQSRRATIGGGRGNHIGTSATSATIGGGDSNWVQDNGANATIPGGFSNSATNYAFAAGFHAQAMHTGAFVWADGSASASFNSTANNEFAVRANGGARFVTGGAGLTVDGPVYADSAAQNTGALNPGLVFGGTGSGEGISSKRTSGTDQYGLDFYTQSNIRMTVNNNGNVGIGTSAPLNKFVVQADDTLTYKDAKQLVIQGDNNTNRQLELGYKTADSANYGTIQAVEQNTAYRPLVLQPAGGSVGINKTNPASALDVNGTVTATAFNPPSDRNLKENFTAVQGREILEKVAGLSISRWNFKGDDRTPHVGPMAQDFYAAFHVGTDDKHIATVDADGVALAAIQGLNQKLEETRADNAALRADNADLRARLEKLEWLLQPSN